MSEQRRVSTTIEDLSEEYGDSHIEILQLFSALKECRSNKGKKSFFGGDKGEEFFISAAKQMLVTFDKLPYCTSRRCEINVIHRVGRALEDYVRIDRTLLAYYAFWEENKDGFETRLKSLIWKL